MLDRRFYGPYPKNCRKPPNRQASRNRLRTEFRGLSRRVATQQRIWTSYLLAIRRGSGWRSRAPNNQQEDFLLVFHGLSVVELFDPV